MHIPDPFLWLSPVARKRIWFGSLVISATFLLAMHMLDAVENYALIRLLLGAQHKLYPAMAWGCAWIKFTLVGIGLAYMLVGFILSRREGTKGQG